MNVKAVMISILPGEVGNIRSGVLDPFAFIFFSILSTLLALCFFALARISISLGEPLLI